MKGNPGQTGYSGFGSNFRMETSNIKSQNLNIPQTVASPGKGPMKMSGGGKGPGQVKFGPAKVPQPAKNRVGFTTSD